MIAKYVKRLFLHNREFIVKEGFEVKELMHLLMKYKLTGQMLSFIAFYSASLF